VFGDGPRRPLDREQRARFRYLLEMHYRAGRVPAKQHRVGEALLKRLGIDGRCDPTQATLASDAGCKPRTVRRAITTLRGLGLLRWQTRLVRAGWRAEQTSNAYELAPTLAAPPVLPHARCGGQSGRETPRELIRPVPLPSPAERQAALEALARIRAARSARLGLA